MDVKKIIVGIGGSATNDAGLGMMQALGFKCLDASGTEVSFGGEGLIQLASITPPSDPHLIKLINTCEILVACDVNNPLYGINGAAYVYGPQKGANQEMVLLLDKGLQNFAGCVKECLGLDVSDLPGAGAAGGLGGGLTAALNAKLMPGFEIIRQQTGLDAILESDIDLVITAEGQMNHQSLNGKLPIELAELAKAYGINTVALVGSREISFDSIKDTGLIGVFPIVNKPMGLDDSISNAEELISETLINILNLLHT